MTLTPKDTAQFVFNALSVERIVNNDEVDQNGKVRASVECQCCNIKLILPKRCPEICVKCQHVYDKDCLDKLKNKKCQICQQTRFMQAKNIPAIVRDWKICKVSCKFSANGCKVVKNLLEIEDHEIHECQFQNRCEECHKYFRGTLQEHQITSCDFFKLACFHCNSVHERAFLLDKHECSQNYSNYLLEIRPEQIKFEFLGDASNKQLILKSLLCTGCENLPIEPMECTKCQRLICKKCRVNKCSRCQDCQGTQFQQVITNTQAYLNQVKVRCQKCPVNEPPKWITLERWVSHYFEEHFYCDSCHKKIERKEDSKLSTKKTIDKHLYIECQRYKSTCAFCHVSFPRVMFANHTCSYYFTKRIIETAIIAFTFLSQFYLFGINKGLEPYQCSVWGQFVKFFGEGIMSGAVLVAIILICYVNAISISDKTQKTSYMAIGGAAALLFCINLISVSHCQSLCTDQVVYYDYLKKGKFYTDSGLIMATLVYWIIIAAGSALCAQKIWQLNLNLKQCDAKGFLHLR